MKSSPLLLLFALVSVRALDAQTATGTSPEPLAAGAVTINGAIESEGSGFPIPYTSVKLLPAGRERFADQNGKFVWYSVPPGEHRIQLRMLGYVPLDTAIFVIANIPLSLKMRMTRIPTSLEQVQVSAPPRRCIFPDEMGYVDDEELATVLNEAKKNAQREQLLRKTYPFEYRLAQSHDTYDLAAGTSSTQHDTVTYRSDDFWRYRKGRVVSDDRSRIWGEVRLMRLPTLADLADRSFLEAHCFKYAGVVDERGTPAHRIDFSPDSQNIAPDVEGSIYLDSATYLIRRAQFRLTRGGAVKPAILGMEVTTTYREILPNVALFDEIQSIQPLGVMTPGGNPLEYREVQRLMTYRFMYTGPPGTLGLKWIAVTPSSESTGSGGNGRSFEAAVAVGPQP